MPHFLIMRHANLALLSLKGYPPCNPLGLVLYAKHIRLGGPLQGVTQRGCWVCWLGARGPPDVLWLCHKEATHIYIPPPQGGDI
jgi:hypothetical protein